MQRENKWQDIENLLSGELDVLENAISDENRTLAICSREEIWKLIYRLIDRAVAEERKAFGGCTKCYGKGYATTKSFTHYCADFIGDKSYLTENSKIRPCSCDRGNQIKEIINLDKLIDQWIGEGKETDLGENRHNVGYNKALQDLKSRKQELVEGIVEMAEAKLNEATLNLDTRIPYEEGTLV